MCRDRGVMSTRGRHGARRRRKARPGHGPAHRDASKCRLASSVRPASSRNRARRAGSSPAPRRRTATARSMKCRSSRRYASRSAEQPRRPSAWRRFRSVYASADVRTESARRPNRERASFADEPAGAGSGRGLVASVVSAGGGGSVADGPPVTEPPTSRGPRSATVSDRAPSAAAIVGHRRLPARSSGRRATNTGVSPAGRSRPPSASAPPPPRTGAPPSASLIPISAGRTRGPPRRP